jgi:hypothetical protein
MTFTIGTLSPVAQLVKKLANGCNSWDRRTGARVPRSIMEALLLDTIFDLPSLEGVEEVVISLQAVHAPCGRASTSPKTPTEAAKVSIQVFGVPRVPLLLLFFGNQFKKTLAMVPICNGRE